MASERISERIEEKLQIDLCSNRQPLVNPSTVRRNFFLCLQNILVERVPPLSSCISRPADPRRQYGAWWYQAASNAFCNKRHAPRLALTAGPRILIIRGPPELVAGAISSTMSPPACCLISSRPRPDLLRSISVTTFSDTSTSSKACGTAGRGGGGG